MSPLFVAEDLGGGFEPRFQRLALSLSLEDLLLQS
jgi:hypothetical protein